MIRLLTLLLLFCSLQARVNAGVLPSFSQGSLNQDQQGFGLYLSQLSSVLTASALNQDMQAALASGTIAAQENAFFVPLILVGLSAYEAYDIYQTYQRDGAEAALTQAGISIGLAASGGVVVKYGGKLGGKVITKVYPNLHQAWLGLVESNPILSKVIAVADGGINAIKQLDSQASQAVGKLWRKAGGKGVAIKAKPEQTLVLKEKPGMHAQDFDRKVRALDDLATRGKLFKSQAHRDSRVTDKYRVRLKVRAEEKWGESDPARFQRFKDRLSKMDADHLHELQLGGKDIPSELGLLDMSVNRSIGSQIRHQLNNLPDGTKITRVIKE